MRVTDSGEILPDLTSEQLSVEAVRVISKLNTTQMVLLLGKICNTNPQYIIDLRKTL